MSHLSARTTTPLPFSQSLQVTSATVPAQSEAVAATGLDARAERLAVPALSARSGTTRASAATSVFGQSAVRSQAREGPLRLQLLEENLANLSGVDAPARYGTLAE
jgi:hypothetical protein